MLSCTALQLPRSCSDGEDSELGDFLRVQAPSSEQQAGIVRSRSAALHAVPEQRACLPVQDWAVQSFLLLRLLNDTLSQELLEVRQVVQESIVCAQLVRQQMINHVHPKYEVNSGKSSLLRPLRAKD